MSSLKIFAKTIELAAKAQIEIVEPIYNLRRKNDMTYIDCKAIAEK